MAKPIKLKAALDTNGSYRINVPAILSPDGKRKNKYFAKKSDAIAYAEQLKARKENFGVKLGSALSPQQIAECHEAYNRLSAVSGLNASLLDAVNEYILRHNQRTASVTLEYLFNQYIAIKAKNHKRSEALKQLAIASLC